jgi:amidophosphoribosyltransferase
LRGKRKKIKKQIENIHIYPDCTREVLFFVRRKKICGRIKIIMGHLNEKCAVIGVYTSSKHAASYAKQGLASLQHRGQESTGISVYSQGQIKTSKGMGFVPFVLTDEKIKGLGPSDMAIGHNRYGTSGDSSVDTAQPIQGVSGLYELSLGHNGNIPDITNLDRYVPAGEKIHSDTAFMASLLARLRPQYESWEKTFAAVLPKFKGAYCLTVLTNDGLLYGIRDPYGIRPLVLGKLPSGWIIASESVALDVTGAEFIRDVKQGEIIKVTQNGDISSTFFGESKHAQWCIFEYIYFSRPDSFLNGK